MLPSSPNNRTRAGGLSLFTLAGFWTFFAFGFVDNLKGPLLPEIVSSGAMNYAAAGTLIFANYLGFIAATLSSGLMADRLSNRMVLWIAGWFLLLGLIGLGICQSYWALTAAMVIMGLGLGAIELGANGLMIELHAAQRGRYLNLLSVFHGCGSLVVPLAAAQLINWHWTWQSIYAACGLMAWPLIGIFLPVSRRIPSGTESVNAQSPEPRPTSLDSSIPKPRLLVIGFTSTMWGYYVLIATYVATELSIGAWMMDYLQKQHAFSVDVSSRYLSGFFVMLMTGRLLGAWIVEKFDYLWAVAIALVATWFCIATALYFQHRWLLLLPASGLCMSIVFPTVTASVSRLHPANSGAIMGLLFGFGGLGGALGPWLVGLVSQQYGISLGLKLTLAFNLLALLALVYLKTFGQRRLQTAGENRRQ